MATVPITLSKVTPDFESLLLQLQLAVQQMDSWKDLQTSGTGQTLMEQMSAVGAFNQFGIESAFREAYLTAVRDSSIFAITDLLGVRLSRKTPTQVIVDMSRTDSTTLSEVVPRFTQFSINGKDYFNRTPLIFAAGSAGAAERLFYGLPMQVVDNKNIKLNVEQFIEYINVGDLFSLLVTNGFTDTLVPVIYMGNNLFTSNIVAPWIANSRIAVLSYEVSLFQGTVKTQNFFSDGSDFRRVIVEEPNFVVSDIDVVVTVVSVDGTRTAWNKTDDGLWIAAADANVYYDSTTANGELLLQFGNSMFGAVPPLGTTIEVQYAVVEGSATNNGISNLEVKCNSRPLTGRTISNMYGGADENNAAFYRVMAPHIFKARNRAVRKDDYIACALDYPGIVSASVQGQKDIAPNDLRWMNVVRVCLLPKQGDALTPADWQTFLDYFAKKRHAAVDIQTYNPIKQKVELEVVVYTKTQYIPKDVAAAVESRIRTLFSRRKDTLGRVIAMTDIVDTALYEKGADYLDIPVCRIEGQTEPVNDLVPDSVLHYLEIDRLTVSYQYSDRTIHRALR